MKVWLLFNPKAGSAGQIDRLREELARRHRLTVVETRDAADLAHKATDAARQRPGAIAVAGGDGTLHTVVNGLGPHFPHTPLAVLPLGTGNDLCRTLAVPLDPVEAVRLIRRGRKRALDVVRVVGGASPYMVNAATGGFSGRVAADVTHELKQFWGPLAYLRGAAGPIAERESYRATLRFDDGPPETLDVLNVVVANGRTAAGGVGVAPLANPEDGLLDVVVVKAGDFLDLSVVTAHLLAGDYLADENVIHRRARQVAITSDPPMPFSIDGELVESSDISFRVVPKALRVFPGPGYRPDPRGRAVGWGGPRQWFFETMAAVLWVFARAVRWPGAGYTLAAVAVALFAWLTRGVLTDGFAETNEAIGRALHEQATPELTQAALAVTHLGDPPVSGVLAAIIMLWFVARRWYALALGVCVVLLGVGATELTLKPWFAVARPDWFGPPDPDIGKFGYPSGHALRSVGLAGYLALVLVAGHPGSRWRWVAALGLLILAALVCVTRVYLASVHSAADVTAGALLGTAWASACAASVYRVRPGPAVSPCSSAPPPPR